MKQTVRNSTNDLHRRFFATIQDHYVYGLRCVHLCTPLSLFNPRSTCSQFSTLFLRIFRLQVRSSYPRSDERKEKREKDSQFERKKETKTNRYRGIGLVWPYIQRVSSGWDRWLMHSREDEMEILSRSGGSRRRRRRSSSFRLRCSSVRLARIGWKRRDGKEG